MENEELQFRTQEPAKPENSEIKKKLSMMQSFASAITSRGLKNEKVTKPIKQLRVLSCFGDKNQGGCGCGDRAGTWLMSEADKYSKLDYPRLSCPLQMPGFTNYEKSKPDEAISPITRRYYIENYPYEKLETIKVNTFEPPPPPQKKQENKPT
jgi:hypothetical protein